MTTDSQITQVHPRLHQPDELQAWRGQSIRLLLRASVIFGAIALMATFSQIRNAWAIPLYVGSYAGVVLVAFWPRASTRAQAIAVLFLIFGLGVLSLVEDGLSGDGRVFLLALPLLTIFFFGRREGLLALALSVVTLGIFAWVYSMRWLTIPEERTIYSANPGAWIGGIFIFLLIGVLIVISQSSLVLRLIEALGRSREMVKAMDDAQNTLRERAERLETAQSLLEKRARALEATALVARAATATLDPDELLDKTAAQISQLFGFYHTGIFMVDAAGEWARLRSASGEGGRRMLARGHSLRVGQPGAVGDVIRGGAACIVLDVNVDAAYANNPDLPETRSEIALPLLARGKTIGVLDVQSRDPHAFSQEDLVVLQTLADQVALAISNAQLFQQAQASLQAERQAFARLGREAWSKLIQTQAGLSRRYDPAGILPSSEALSTTQAAQAGEAIQSLPIKVRGQSIGVIRACKSAEASEWSRDETELLETLTEQLGVALESARLYQDTQRRAARERLLREISDQMQRAADMEALMRIAAEELNQALGSSRAYVRLGAEALQPPNGDEPSGEGDI
jgi:GAF domain-containing protein